MISNIKRKSGVNSKPLIKNKSFALPYHNNYFVLELDIIVIRLVLLLINLLGIIGLNRVFILHEIFVIWILLNAIEKSACSNNWYLMLYCINQQMVIFLGLMTKHSFQFRCSIVTPCSRTALGFKYFVRRVKYFLCWK